MAMIRKYIYVGLILIALSIGLTVSLQLRPEPKFLTADNTTESDRKLPISDEKSVLHYAGQDWQYFKTFDMPNQPNGKTDWYKCGKTHIRLLVSMGYQSDPPDIASANIESYKNGEWLRNGLMTIWHENNMITVADCVDGELHGSAYTMHPNGRLAASINYVRGEFDGIIMGWWDNGQKQSVENYDNGQLISRQTWDRDGSLIYSSN